MQPRWRFGRMARGEQAGGHHTRDGRDPRRARRRPRRVRRRQPDGGRRGLRPHARPRPAPRPARPPPARPGRLARDVAARGALETGAHHTAEDVGIVLGQALDRALGDRAGITRYGHAVVPMDEARASCAIDISGRPFLSFDPGALPPGVTGGFDHELTEEFLRAVANGARLTLHVTVEAGTNAHHMMEAAFKAFARALRMAIAIDPGESGVPSTKGTLTA